MATEFFDLGGTLRVVPETTVTHTLAALGVQADSGGRVRRCASNAAARSTGNGSCLPLWVVREQDTNGPWVHHPEGRPR